MTVAGAVEPGTDFDPDRIAELFWTAHTDPKDDWKTEYRFTGACAARRRRDGCFADSSYHPSICYSTAAQAGTV